MKNGTCTGELYGETITVKQITVVEAKRLYDAGTNIYLLPSLLRPFNIWQPILLCVPENEGTLAFKTLIDSFIHYNCGPQRGKTINYFKKL